MKTIQKSFLSALAEAVLILTSLPMTVSSAEPKTKLIARTFDDGPNTTTTNEVLDVLAEYGAVGSFFLIGDNINAESAESVKRAYAMGCEIDNHSKTHSYMSDMSAEELALEISYVDDYVYELTGEHTKFFRPPYIDVSQSMYDAIDLPFICGLGSGDSDQTTTAEQRTETVISSAKDGLIILMHDFPGNSKTVEALKFIIPALQREGYEFVTLSELFERQGETPKQNILYSEVTKYPCEEYTLYQNISSDRADRIVLDAAVLAQLGDSYAIEVNYSGNERPPVVALQKWTDSDTIWHAVQPVYYNGERACFLASDLLSGLTELDKSYADLDRICISPYGGEIILTDAKLLVKSDTSELLMGDVNNNGTFELTDVIMLQKWLLGSGRLTNWKAGDFNDDKIINIFDLVLMKRKLLEIDQRIG